MDRLDEYYKWMNMNWWIDGGMNEYIDRWMDRHLMDGMDEYINEMNE